MIIHLNLITDLLNSHACGLSYLLVNQSFNSINWLKSVNIKTLINQFLQDIFTRYEKIPPMFELENFKEKLWTSKRAKGHFYKIKNM